MVTHIPGSSKGIISSLPGSGVIKPRCRPGLSNFSQPQHNFLLKQSRERHGRRLKDTLRVTMEFFEFFTLSKYFRNAFFCHATAVPEIQISKRYPNMSFNKN